MNNSDDLPSPVIKGQYNIGHICTRQQCDSGKAARTALRWISPSLKAVDYTYQDLETHSNRVANALIDLGIKPGDRICIFLPRSPELFFIFLGILKIQAVAVVLFSNFGEQAIFDRLSDCAARLLFTAQNLLQKVRPIWPNLPALEKAVVVDLDQDESDRVVSYEKVLSHTSPVFLAPPTPAETPSVLHYTSGSTGKPKGVQHVHRSILSLAATFRNVLSVLPDDIFWCTADPGWVTGTSYGIIAPFSQGITQVQFGGIFQAGTWFRVLQETKVNIWYSAPTALRILMKEKDALYTRFDLSHLRHIFSVGEPLNPAVIEWGRRVLNRDILDTWFQTETGAIMIANHPGLEIQPGSMGVPVDQVKAVILDEKGEQLPDREKGRLCLQPGWPSMFVTYLNAESEYQSRFKNGYFDTGDVAYRDSKGYFWFTGRGDDVINTAGHLVGPFEVESALIEIPEVAEAGVIGAPDGLLYEKVVAFVRLKKDVQWSRELEIKLRLHVSNRVSTNATPQEFRVVDWLPRNKSGKIMRRVLKAWYVGRDAGDISTMDHELLNEGDESQVSRVTRSREAAKSSYDRMSRWYDLLSGKSEKAACQEGLRMLAVKEGESVLEIGFGTGHNLLALARAVGGSGRVCGIDLSEGMLAVAQRRIERAGYGGWVELRIGDAASLPYEADSFQAVFSSFTLELFDTPEIPRVLREWRRVLKAGGRVGIVSLARHGELNAMTRLYEWAHGKFPNVVDCRPILVRRSLEAAGLGVQQVVQWSMWGLPVEMVVGIHGADAS